MKTIISVWSIALMWAILNSAATTAPAQQVYAPPPGAPPAGAPPAAAPQPATSDETQRQLEELQRRLERCEEQLQAGAGAQAAANGYVPANPTGYVGQPGSPSGPGTPSSPPVTVGNLPPGAEAIQPGPCEQACEPARSGPTLHIGAKAILDNGDFAQSTANRKEVGTEPDLTGFRFLRVMFYGDLAENIDYRLEIDLAQSVPGSTTLETAFQDVWVHVGDLPVMGNVKVGYFKEPFGLEQQTGEEYLLFMERSLANAFVPARRIGIMAYNDLNDDKTLTWFTGTFREGSGDKTFLEYSDEGDFGTTTRLVWLPYYDPTTNGRYLVHLGAAYEFTGTDNNTSGAPADSKTFSFTPEINAQTNFGSVTIPCDYFQLFGAEAAVMDGPLLFMAEYMRTWMTDTGLHDEDVFCDGGYAEVLYLITGENHNYIMNGKFFRGVDPYEPFFHVRTEDGVCSGWGAWELGARVSFIDLNRFGLAGGDCTDYTLGLHWYLTSNLSLQFNYIYSDLAKKGTDTVCNIIGERVEWHF